MTPILPRVRSIRSGLSLLLAVLATAALTGVPATPAARAALAGGGLAGSGLAGAPYSAPRGGDATRLEVVPTRVQLSATARVVYGTRTTLVGQVQAQQTDGTWGYLPSVSVRVDMRRVGRTTYQRLAYATAGTDGVFRLTHLPVTATEYHAYYPGGPAMGVTFAASTSPWRVTAVSPQLTAKVTTSGLAFSVSGLVRPRSDGQRVYLQRRIGTSYRTVTSAVVISTPYSYNTYRLASTAPAAVGTYSYRVYYPPLGGRTAGTAYFTVRVFEA